MSADLRGSSTDTPATGDQPRPADQPRGADQLPVPPVTDQAAGAAARRQKWGHLFEGASETSPRPGLPAQPAAETGQVPSSAVRTGHPQGAWHADGADRTGTHPYPEVPGSTLPAHDVRQAGHAQGHPAHANVAGEASDAGNDGIPGQDAATGQDTHSPVPRGGISSEAAGQGDATEPAEASGQDGPQDVAAEADATGALKRRIAELEAANADLAAKSAAKDAVIAEQHDAIDAKDAAITERDVTMAEKDATITGQWRVISELGNRVDDLAAENEGLQDEKAAAVARIRDLEAKAAAAGQQDAQVTSDGTGDEAGLADAGDIDKSSADGPDRGAQEFSGRSISGPEDMEFVKSAVGFLQSAGISIPGTDLILGGDSTRRALEKMPPEHQVRVMQLAEAAGTMSGSMSPGTVVAALATSVFGPGVYAKARNVIHKIMRHKD